MRKISLINVSVYLTILGYWYNLPIISTSIFGGYNEFRLYDLTFILLALLLFKHGDLKRNIWALKADSSLKHIYRFAYWASVMTIPTIIFVAVKGNFVYMGMTIMFLYHLWGFVLLAAVIKTYYDHAAVTRLISWFLTLSTLHLFVYYAQVSGILGHLWAQVYIDVYGEGAYSGTLGPNRITPSMMTLLGFVMSIYVLVKWIDLRYLKIISWINIFMALPAILMIGSRTTFVTLVVFVIIYVLIYRRKLISFVALLIPIFIIVYNNGLNQKQRDRITSNIEYNERKLLRGGNLNDLTIIEGYENIGAGRAQISEHYIPFLLNNSYIIPFGIGFNNRIISRSTGAASAHNVYLSLINELGLVGLILYLSWLISYLKDDRKLNRLYPKSEGHGIISSLVIAMLISLLAGEHIYVYRPCFAIMGTFIFVVTVISITEHASTEEVEF